MEQTEDRISKLKEELVNLKEALNKTQLHRDMLDREKQETGEWHDWWLEAMLDCQMTRTSNEFDVDVCRDFYRIKLCNTDDMT